MAGEPSFSTVPPMPQPDSLSTWFWSGVAEHRLVILRCASCGHYIHFPRPVCRFCRGSDLSPVEVSGKGSVYSYTVARQAFHPWFRDRLPYVIAVIELVEERGLRMMSNIVGCEPSAVSVGSQVEVTFERAGNELVLPMFRLATT